MIELTRDVATTPAQPAGPTPPGSASTAAHVALTIQQQSSGFLQLSAPSTSPAATTGVVQRMDYSKRWNQVSKDPLFHEPESDLDSPTSSQQEVLDNVFGEMDALSKVQIEKKRKAKPQPKETVKGSIGEFDAANQFKSDGIPVLDANRVIQKNIAGIDHIINYGSFCFSQSKVHSSETLTVAQITVAYEKEIENRYSMALLFIQKILKGDKLDELAKANKTLGKNAVLGEIIDLLMEEDPDGAGDLDESSDVVEKAGDALIFPVPSNIYPKLKSKYRKHAYKLDHDVKWYTDTLDRSYFMEKKTRLTGEAREKHSDPDFK